MESILKPLNFFFALLYTISIAAQPTINMLKSFENSPLLENILNDNADVLQPVLGNASKFKLQIIYTQINRDNKNRPSFSHHYYRAGAEYFYPASTVKLPAAVLALEYINELKKYGIDKHTTLLTDAVRPNELPVTADSTAENGLPSVAHYIRKILLISDNDAFNRLYELIGQEAFNNRLHELGFKDAQIIHRLEISLTEKENRQTNPVRFVDENGRILYQQPAKLSNLSFASRNDRIGTGFMKSGQLIQQPLDFSIKNRWPLAHIHQLVRWIMFPETQPKNNRLKLTADDYIFLRKYMSMMPQESKYPHYSPSEMWPAYVKFLLYGSQKTVPISPDIRMFNKVGDAYGFLIDGAYIADFKNGVEFILSAVLYCNEDGILNDNNYEYEKIGFPFLKALGNVVYEFEMKRKKTIVPDLKEFRYDYRH